MSESFDPPTSPVELAASYFPLYRRMLFCYDMERFFDSIEQEAREMHAGKSLQLPKIGMRNIKVSVATALCALLYFLCGRSPAFACIGVIFGFGRDWEDSYKNGGNRLYGTLIGGLIGMGLFRLYLCFEPEGGHTWLLAVFILFGTMLLIWVCNIFWVGGVQPGGVVLCIVMFNTPIDTYVSYSINRIVDTAIGVLFAWAVSWLVPRDFKAVWAQRLARWKKA